ncbi:MAG: hypothetical protein L6264_06825 [Weeksellaceae bacterium]|nr:TerB family tellurite resistance protein [Bacteroidota bacterium]MCG2780644.1 hypothetical protein [Weeksellaceae bacterium]
MEVSKFEKLLLKTAFCCMASDGHIDQREIYAIENLSASSDMFNDLELHHEINSLVKEININGKQFIQHYLDELDSSALTEKEEITLIDFAIKTINADELIEYAEIKFFKNIRHRLKISDAKILSHHPDIEDFLEEDIKDDSYLQSITANFLETIELPQFDIINLTK